MKVLSEDSTLVCGFSIPGDIPYVHKCQPGLQVLSLNTKLFSKIPTWGDYKILRPYLEIADYDYEHECRECVLKKGLSLRSWYGKAQVFL
jgi:hypothetical protein